MAVINEGRLPYRVGTVLDRIFLAIGNRHKIIRANGIVIKMHRGSREWIFVQNIIIDQEYTPGEYSIKRNNTVIDIGANIGIFSLFAALQSVNGEVYSFEPVRDNFNLLVENVSRNKLKNIVPRKAAVSAKSGTARIFLSEVNTGCHSTNQGPHPGGSYEDVEAISMDDFLRDYSISHVDLLKLDCEGAEYEILYSMPVAQLRKIHRITMEYHSTTPGQTSTEQSSELVSYLQDVGYRIDAYLDFGGGGFIRAMKL